MEAVAPVDTALVSPVVKSRVLELDFASVRTIIARVPLSDGSSNEPRG